MDNLESGDSADKKTQDGDDALKKNLFESTQILCSSDPSVGFLLQFSFNQYLPTASFLSLPRKLFFFPRTFFIFSPSKELHLIPLDAPPGHMQLIPGCLSSTSSLSSSYALQTFPPESRAKPPAHLFHARFPLIKSTPLQTPLPNSSLDKVGRRCHCCVPPETLWLARKTCI